MTDATAPVHDAADMDPGCVADEDLGDLASALAATVAEVRRHGVVLDRLRSAQEGGEPRPQGSAPHSVFILTVADEAYEAELAALRNWVHGVLLPNYGREVSTARPWCEQWHEHPEAVARLHALWLAWRELTGAAAGLTGPSVWHRDHLDIAMLQLRAPDGPFAACTTDARRPNHRLLLPPGSQSGGAAE
ncbi:DUF4913 domain-containing protein [Streptomyces sp. NPDC021224]|uniref:DUF4913 domain-containing protein n=1 Tax=unclassified Streptomyces TaxID=2593676 RepID=UPI0037AD26BE